MELFDSHCHIDVAEFADDREQVIAHAHELGVKQMLVPAVLARDFDQLLATCKQHEGLYPALGLHPVYDKLHQPQDIETLVEHIQQHRPVAVGEIGLDFYIPEADRELQIKLFEHQLQIAVEFQLPVVLHLRKAYEEILLILRRYPKIGGTAHAFNGSLQQAEQYIKLGFKLGFGGMLTYERSNKLRKLATEIDLEHMVLETDAPDMTGFKHHGQRNSPEYLPEVVQALASIKIITEEQVAEVTTRNSREVFKLS